MFNLTAKVDDSSMVWAAVGFLADRNMVMDLVIKIFAIIAF